MGSLQYSSFVLPELSLSDLLCKSLIIKAESVSSARRSCRVRNPKTPSLIHTHAMPCRTKRSLALLVIKCCSYAKTRSKCQSQSACKQDHRSVIRLPCPYHSAKLNVHAKAYHSTACWPVFSQCANPYANFAPRTSSIGRSR